MWHEPTKGLPCIPCRPEIRCHKQQPATQAHEPGRRAGRALEAQWTKLQQNSEQGNVWHQSAGQQRMWARSSVGEE